MTRMFLLSALLLCSSGVLTAAQGPLIEEVIVTAQRVEENASQVPAALNAYSEPGLDDRIMIALDDLQTFVPNLSYATTNVGDMTLSVRGVGSLVSVNDGESGVSLHVNEVPLPPGQPPIELYDVERIEVLRGPEGTLYGRNATGGVINILTKQPGFEGSGGYLDVEGGDYDLFRLRGALNVTVNDALAFRVAGLVHNRDGYTNNLAAGQLPGAGKDIDGRDLYSVRASGIWRLSDRSQLRLMYEHFDEDDDRAFTHQSLCKTGLTPVSGCEPGVFGLEAANPSAGVLGMLMGARGIIPMGARDSATGLVFRYPRPEITNLRDVHLDFEPEYEFEQDVWQLELRHEAEWATFVFTGGYQEWDRRWAFDGDGGVGYELNADSRNPSGVWPVSRIPDGLDGLNDPQCNVEAGQFGVLGGCTLDMGLTRAFQYVDEDERREQWSAEARMRTDLEGPVNFLVGVNYQWSKSRQLLSGFFNVADYQMLYGAALTPELVGFEEDNSIAFYPGSNITEAINEFESVSAFGEAYWQLNNRLKLTMGLRYNRDTKDIADRVINANAVDINDSAVFNGLLGPDPVWVRFFSFDPARRTALFDLYGAREAVEAAGGNVAQPGPFSYGPAFEMGTAAELIEATQLVPIVPQLNENRLLEGIPTEDTWDAWTGRIVLDWQATDEIMIYGKYSRGYKPGGFNPGTAVQTFQFRRLDDVALTYDREDVNAFEVGAKSLLFEGTLSLSVATFYNDYEALQLAETDLESLSNAAVNTNVDADMFGAEVEVRWRPAFAPRAEFELGYAWLDAEVKNLPPRIDPQNLTGGDPSLIHLSDWQTSFTPYVAPIDEVLPLVELATGQPFPWAWGADRAPAAQYSNGIPAWFDRSFLEFFGVTTSPGVPVDVSGNQLPESPEHSIHLAASYTWEVPVGALTARWDYYWQDDAYMTIFNRPSHRIDDWDIHNASLVLESQDNRWSLRAWVKNIDDDVHITGGLRSGAAFFSVSEPRTYGASFRYNFGAL